MVTQSLRGLPHRLLALLISTREWRFFWGCLLVGALLRVTVIVVSMTKGWVYIENMDEIQVAQALLEGRGYSFNYYELFGPEAVPGAFFPPAYVFNAYVLGSLFGSSLPLVIENALFSLGVSVCVYGLARSTHDFVTARLALLWSVLYVPFYSRLTHGSPVYFKMFFMALAVFLLSRAWASDRKRGYFFAGLPLGILALAMPDVLLYLGMIAVLLLARTGSLRRRIGRAIALLGAAAILIAPWSGRNWARFHKFELVSTNGGFNFWMGHNPWTINEADMSRVHDLDTQLNGELSRADEFERDDIFYREGLRFLRAHPLESLVNMLERGLIHWVFRLRFLEVVVPGSIAKSGVLGLYTWSYIVSYVPMALLCAWGVWIGRRRLPAMAPVLSTFVYSTLVTMLFVAQTKQRLIKVEPFMLIFASAALVALFVRRGWIRLQDGPPG